jgi:hypothetical protein
MQESFFKQGASTCLNLILELFSFLDRGVTCDTRGVTRVALLTMCRALLRKHLHHPRPPAHMCAAKVHCAADGQKEVPFHDMRKWFPSKLCVPRPSARPCLYPFPAAFDRAEAGWNPQACGYLCLACSPTATQTSSVLDLLREIEAEALIQHRQESLAAVTRCARQNLSIKRKEESQATIK